MHFLYPHIVHFTIPRLVGTVCGLMVLIVAAQGAFPPSPPMQPLPDEPAAPCIGEPIGVEYAFTGWSEPHACVVQCSDNQPRYILYSDGKATQCETPPGCNDWGEDKGVLCEPPLKSA